MDITTEEWMIMIGTVGIIIAVLYFQKVCTKSTLEEAKEWVKNSHK